MSMSMSMSMSMCVSGPTLEEKIDEARRKLDLSKCTPVTLETFKKWKEERAKKKVTSKHETGARWIWIDGAYDRSLWHVPMGCVSMCRCADVMCDVMCGVRRCDV